MMKPDFKLRKLLIEMRRLTFNFRRISPYQDGYNQLVGTTYTIVGLIKCIGRMYKLNGRHSNSICEAIKSECEAIKMNDGNQRP
jgi:hypothetical protein